MQLIFSLQTAHSSPRRNHFLNAARSEEKLIRCYKVTPESLRGGGRPLETDQVSVNIFHPAILYNNRPISVVGDGNCLYRAVSVAMTGSEDAHVLLRLLTAIELGSKDRRTA